MFGKPRRTKTSNEKFIIGKGIDAGNLKGRGTSQKTAPMASGSPMGIPKESQRAMSPGKAGPVKITGD